MSLIKPRDCSYSFHSIFVSREISIDVTLYGSDTGHHFSFVRLSKHLVLWTRRQRRCFTLAIPSKRDGRQQVEKSPVGKLLTNNNVHKNNNVIRNSEILNYCTSTNVINCIIIVYSKTNGWNIQQMNKRKKVEDTSLVRNNELFAFSSKKTIDWKDVGKETINALL